jgi:5'-nucleotidase
MAIALIDLDGTTADFDGEMSRRMLPLYSPGETTYDEVYDGVPPHIEARRDLIKHTPGFWEGLPRVELGFHVVEYLRETGYQLNVLTKCSKRNAPAWAEKINWCCKHLPDASYTITELKSLVYGRVLVDDYPPYFLLWLEVRPRGVVISVAHPWNEGIKHPRVVRYDGTNMAEVRAAIDLAKVGAWP